MNARMQIRVKGVFTIPLLEKLVNVVKRFQNRQFYKTVFVVVLFVFYILPHFCLAHKYARLVRVSGSSATYIKELINSGVLASRLSVPHPG